MRFRPLVCLFLLFFVTPSFAHGDLDLQIERLSKQIEKTPENPDLYLHRGQLYCKHRELQKAKNDYFKVLGLNDQAIITYLLLAQLYSEDAKPDSALIYVGIYLEERPNNVDGLITRSGIYQQKSQKEAAKADLETAFSFLPNPEPRHFIAIANATLLAEATNYSEAFNWIKKGQSILGTDIVLEEKEIELLCEAKLYTEALEKINHQIDSFPRKEKWLFKKASLLEEMKQSEKALTVYQKTLFNIQLLPTRLQKTSRIIELEAQAMEGIQRLSQ